MGYNCWFRVIVGCSVAPSSQQHHDFERSFIASNENTRRKEAAGVIEGENEWLFLKKADNCGAWLDDTICKGSRKLPFRAFSLVITYNPDFQLVRRGAEMREGVPMPNDGHESGISDVTWCDNLDVPPYNPGHHNPYWIIYFQFRCKVSSSRWSLWKGRAANLTFTVSLCDGITLCKVTDAIQSCIFIYIYYGATETRGASAYYLSRTGQATATRVTPRIV